MAWCDCTCTNARVLITRNLSLNGRDHRPAAGFDAVSSFMIARNAGESLMGRVVAFCIEKSCRSTVALVVPFKVRSTEKDNDRTSALKSEFLLGSAFPNRTTAG